MIGFYGDIVFETSDKRIITFQGFQRKASSRWAAHQVIGRKPASEFLGPNLDTITFTINLVGKFGVKPVDEANQWLIRSRAGTVDTLVIGNRALGMDKWSVKSVSQMWNVILNRGEVYSASVDVELEEYLEVFRW